MANDPTTTKFIIKASIHVDGVVEKPDIIGAIFGQTEGLLGNELDMRDLQKSARIGRIEVNIDQKGGKTNGSITVPSALEKAESAIIAAGLETIDRIGPSKAEIKVNSIEDARSSRRDHIRERAKELLKLINDDPSQDSTKILDEVKNAVQVGDITTFRGTKIPCGPNVEAAESIIVVEGRNDVVNLLKCGIRNAIGVEGTNVPKEIQDLSREKTTTIFVDGDRGGELIARELLQTCDVDFVARAPQTREVEELPHKLVMKCLKNKLTADQFIAQVGINVKKGAPGKKAPAKKADEKPAGKRPARGRRDADAGDKKPARGRDKPDDDKPARGRGKGRRSDDEEKPARGKGRGGERSDDDKPPAKGRGRGRRDDKPAAKKEAVHDPRSGFRDSLASLSGTLKAIILDKEGQPLKDGLPVRELADTLKSNRKKVQAVIFDGVITQRLLDIAADKSIATVVGVKMGNVTKVPEDVEILTKDDLN